MFFLSLFVSHWANAAEIVLFETDRHSMEWLLTDHEGARKFRSGKQCTDCHERDASDLPGKPLHLTLQASIHDQGMQLNFSWKGSPQTILSVMADAGASQAFARAGCWAACHDDIDGMQAAGGQSKYLGQTRAAMSRSGGGAALKDNATIDAMRTNRNFVHIWQVDLDSAKPAMLSQGSILETKNLKDAREVQATWQDETWQVEFVTEMPGPQTTFDLGILEPSSDQRAHYVSFPLQFIVNDGQVQIANP